MFSRFGAVGACDGRTDRLTYDDSIYRASIASRGKNQPTLIILVKEFRETLTMDDYSVIDFTNRNLKKAFLTINGHYRSQLYWTNS